MVYTETHATTTSPVGSFTLEIGNGIAAQGNSVDSIDLTNDSYFLGMGIDVTGGSDFVDLGATRLLSVPYAIAASYAMESGGAAEFPRNIELNTADGDTSIIVRATGQGTGEVVPEGQEVNGNIGTVNAGMVGFDAFVFGSPANNFGLRGTVLSAGVENYGVSVSVREGSRNIGLQAGVDGSGHNTGLRLFVDRNGASSIGAEIHADTALVLHGYTTSDFGATFSGLQINGDINYSGSLNNTSDRNLKENIRPIGDALGVVMQLNPTSYTFRGNGSWYGLPLSTGTRYGLIAQEVEAVLPALVRNNGGCKPQSVLLIRGD